MKWIGWEAFDMAGPVVYEGRVDGADDGESETV